MKMNWTRILSEAKGNSNLTAVQNPIGRKLAEKFEADLSKVFTDSKMFLPLTEMLIMYRSLLSKRVSTNEALSEVNSFDSILNPWVLETEFLIANGLIVNMQQIIEQGYHLQIAEFASTLGMEHNLGNIANNTYAIREEFIRTVEQRISLLTPQITGASKNQLKNVISTSLKTNSSPGDMVSHLNQLFEDNFANIKAKQIAISNANEMLSAGAFRLANDTGSSKKNWVNVGDKKVSIPICAANTGQGPIPMREAFQSGHMHPLGHYNCRCHNEYSTPTRERLAGFLNF